MEGKTCWFEGSWDGSHASRWCQSSWKGKFLLCLSIYHWEIYLCTETYLCTGKYICALKNIFVPWKTYLWIEKQICALEIYLCTEKYFCALKNVFAHWETCPCIRKWNCEQNQLNLCIKINIYTLKLLNYCIKINIYVQKLLFVHCIYGPPYVPVNHIM